MISRFCVVVRSLGQRFLRRRAGKPRVVVVDQHAKGRLRKFSGTGTAVLLLAALLFAGTWLSYKALDRSDIFRLTMVSVQGNRMTSQAQILDLAGIEQGRGLLSFDVARAEERIGRHPWIDQVTIQRIWPSTLTIQVSEHQPLAMLNIEHEKDGNLYYVDRKCKVFARVENVYDLDFPVITGVELQGEVIGRTLAGKGLIGDAFQFLRLAARGNPIVPLQTISEVHLSRDQGLIVYLVDRPFPIYMGHGSIRTGYYQLVKLLERLYRKKKIPEIKEIRMGYQQGRILVAKVDS